MTTTQQQWKPALTHGQYGMPARYNARGEVAAEGTYESCHRQDGTTWIQIREGRRVDEYPAHLVEVLT